MTRAALTAAVVWFVSVVLWIVALNFVAPIPAGPEASALAQLGWVLLALGPPAIAGWILYRRFHRERERERRVQSASVTTTSGFHFVPAAGTDRDPVICLETNPAFLKTAEREYLHEQLYPSPLNPQVVSEVVRHLDGHTVDILTVQLGVEPREVYFDISRSGAFPHSPNPAGVSNA